MRELASIRKDINSVDSAIRELFLLRMSLAHEVAETKAQSDDKIYKPDREAEIIEQRSAGMEEEVRLKYIALLQSMIRASREYQYSEILRLNPEKFPFHPSSEMLKPKTVFYQGVPGAYQELAARAEGLALAGRLDQAISLLSSASSQVKLGSLQQARYDARIDQLRGLQQRFKPYEKM